MQDKPRFLDEAPSPVRRGTAIPASPPPADRQTAPVLMEAEPDAPTELSGSWRPNELPSLLPSVGGLHWVALGIAVMLVTLALLSAIGFVLSLADRSTILGWASGLALGLGVGLIVRGLVGEWRGYRTLQTVDRLRATLMSDTASIEVLRRAALGWLEQVSTLLPDADGARRAIQLAPTAIEIQAALRNRIADPLHQAAKAIGRQAGIQAACLIAISPPTSWDGLIAGLRGLVVIREVARLFGLRPGWAVTLMLLRKVAWTAAGISGLDLLSQSLTDQVLSGLPFVKHIAQSVPGGGVAALRLYRLATIAATTCCPVRV